MGEADLLKEGVASLARLQEADGSFLSLSSPDSKQLGDGTLRHTTFFTSCLLLALAGLEPSEALTALRTRARAFLVAQASPALSINYWPRHSQEAEQLPYPDDLDDTACAVAALWGGGEVADGLLAGRFARLLTVCEASPGGPYRTWILPPGSPVGWQDVDLAVNANVAYALSLMGVRLPALAEMVERAAAGELCSAYYPDALAVLYFISRWYEGPARPDPASPR